MDGTDIQILWLWIIYEGILYTVAAAQAVIGVVKTLLMVKEGKLNKPLLLMTGLWGLWWFVSYLWLFQYGVFHEFEETGTYVTAMIVMHTLAWVLAAFFFNKVLNIPFLPKKK